MEIAIRQLRSTYREKKATMDELWRSAKVCRVVNVIAAVYGVSDLKQSYSDQHVRIREAAPSQSNREQKSRLSSSSDQIRAGAGFVPHKPSSHNDNFVLQGALLFELWTEQIPSANRDADFLFARRKQPRTVPENLRKICALKVGAGRGSNPRPCDRRILSFRASQ